ncbi:MAG: hypothetical protein WCC21_18295 [Candidatus Acidiferrales bacterium]
MDKHTTAIGGLEALNAMQTLHAQGSFGLPVLNSLGDFHFYFMAPANDVFQFDAITHGQASTGHEEGIPFSWHTGEGIGGLNGVTLGVLDEDWLALIESSLDRRFTRIELVGLTGIDGRWAYALRLTPKSGDPQVRYYDCENFLMVRMDSVERIRLQKGGPESAYKVETYFSDYRDSGGINFPRKIRATANKGDLMLEVHDVRTNSPINDSVFRKN